MIFFTDDQVATMQTGEVNSAQDRHIEILDKMKAQPQADCCDGHPTVTVAEHRRKWRGPKWGLAIPSFVWYTLFFVAADRDHRRRTRSARRTPAS